jgi:urea carboxylase
VGRTVQMWNRYRRTEDFRDGRQWLLRFFDQIRFYPVSAPELMQMREDFPYGRFALDVRHTTLRLRDYRAFLAENAASIAQFKDRQQAAFEAERERWNETVASARPAGPARSTPDSQEIPEGCIAVSSPITGSVWQVGVDAGARVKAGDELLVVEAMKMEIPISADEAGEIIEVRCERGRMICAGETLLVLRPC